MIKPLAQYIADEASLIIGATLHVGHRPTSAAPNCSTLLLRSPGVLNGDPSGLTERIVEVITRGDTYQTALAAAEVIFDTLARKSGIAQGGYKFHVIESRAPAYLGADPSNRHEFITGFTVRYKET